MTYQASTPTEYLNAVDESRHAAFAKLWTTIREHLPDGFEEAMSYGMIGFVVPHTMYPPGYHCDPKLPLPFVGIAAQKNFIALYHMGIYADAALYKWFVDEYQKLNIGKLDMGKSCIRFKKTSQIPYELIGQLIEKMSVRDWVSLYETKFRKAATSA